MQGEEEVARRADAVAAAEKARVGMEERGWQEPVPQQALRTVDIGQDQIEQPRALDEPGLELGPLGGVDDQGQHVQSGPSSRPGSSSARGCSIWSWPIS